MGRAWKLGDNISTDHIAPGRFSHLRSDLPEFAKHCFDGTIDGFVEKVQEGDYLVGGANFGQGSSREHAPLILKMNGITGILAKDFARIFFRNAINIGLPVGACDTDQIDDGDDLEVDFEAGKVVNKTKGIELTVSPLPPQMLRILADGGLVEHIKKHGDLKIA